MGLIEWAMVGVGLLGTLTVHVIGHLLASEVEEWLPRLVEWLVQFAEMRVPERYRERLGEEWRAHLSETTGTLAKLVVALGFCRASLALRHAEQRQINQAKAEANGRAVTLWLYELVFFRFYGRRMPTDFRREFQRVFRQRIDAAVARGSIVSTFQLAEYADHVRHEMSDQIVAAIDQFRTVVEGPRGQAAAQSGIDGVEFVRSALTPMVPDDMRGLLEWMFDGRWCEATAKVLSDGP